MRKDLIKIKVKKKKRVLIMGICILYYHETECNYICGRRGKGSY